MSCVRVLCAAGEFPYPQLLNFACPVSANSLQVVNVRATTPTSAEESDLDWDQNKQLRDMSPPLMAMGSSNQITENSAAYFLWPTVSRPHGNAEERENYFRGHRKDANLKLSETTPSGLHASTLLDLMTIRAYNSKLLRKASLGTAVGYRTRRGVHTDIPAIIVFVAHKVHKVWLNEDDRLPIYLEGPGGVWCDVDVVEFHYYGTPAFTQKEHVYTELAEGLRGNDPQIGPGSQVSSQETIGTLGAIVKSRTGACQIGFLTNRHVAVNLDHPSQKMFHPLPPNIGPGVYLGAVERATSFIRDEGWYSIFASTNPETFVRADGAFVPFSDSLDLSQVTTVVKGLGEMGDIVTIDLQDPICNIIGKKVVKVGRSSGLTRGTIIAYGLEYNDEKGICLFTDFLIVGEHQQAFDMEGDSGSLILMVDEQEESKPRPLGMIWGGAANRGCLKLHNGNQPENWTSGVDLGHLLDWLQLELITNDVSLQDAIRARRRGSCFEESFSGPPANYDDWPTRQPAILDLNLKENDDTATHLEIHVDTIREIDFGLQESNRNIEYNEPAHQINDFNEGISLNLNLNEKVAKRRRQ